MAAPSRAGLALRAVLVGVASGWSFGATGPVARSIADDLGVGLATTGWLMTALLVAHAGAQLPAAWPIERFGASAVARVGLAGVAALSVLAALAPGFEALLAIRLFTGICTGAAFVAGLGVFRQLGGLVAAGWFGGSATLGLAIALLTGGAVRDAGADWRIQLWLGAIAALAGAVAVPAAARTAAQRGAGVVRVVRNRALWRLALLHTATFGTSLVVGAWIVVYLADGGASGTVAGALGFAMLGTAAVLRPVGGVLLARGIGWATVAAGGALLAATGLGILALTSSPLLAVPAAVACGIGLSIPFAPAFGAATAIEPQRTAAATAFVNLTGSVFALAAIPLAGIDVEHGSGGALTWGGLALLALAAAALNRRAPAALG